MTDGTDFADLGDAASTRERVDRAMLPPQVREPEEEKPYVPLKRLDVAGLLKKPAPPHEWIVSGLIPAREVTAFSGDGGGGKTMIALQLAHARACQWPWLGREITPGRSLYYGAEDDRDELHWRLEQINRQIIAGPLEPGVFTLITVAGENAELAVADREFGVRTTRRFEDLEENLRDLEADLLVLEQIPII